MQRLVFALAAGLMAASGAANAQPRAGFTTIDNPGGGHILTASLPGSDAATSAALIDMLRRVHAWFGARPDVRAVLVTPDGSTAIASFAEQAGNAKVIGLVIAGAGATPHGAVVYDEVRRLPQTLGPMLNRLATLVPASQNALPLTRQGFPDDSGSIGVPQGWTLTSPGQGKFLVKGPKGEIVLSGLAFTAFIPGSFMAETTLRLREQGYPSTGAVAFASYQADPLQDALAVAQSLASQQNQPPLKVVKVIADTVLGQFAGATTAYLELVQDAQDGKGPFHVSAEAMIMPPAPQGEWFLSYLMLAAAPEPEADAIRPTILAILNSLQLNQQVLAAERQEQQQWFNSFMKTMQQREDAMDREATAFDRVIRGASVVADANTGKHYETPYDIETVLLAANPDRFHEVPVAEYIKGVDY